MQSCGFDLFSRYTLKMPQHSEPSDKNIFLMPCVISEVFGFDLDGFDLDLDLNEISIKSTTLMV